MTIASQTSRIAYTGDGSTTAFAVPFYFASNSDLVVIFQDTLGNQTTQTLGTNYTLTGATLSAGGTCTFTVAPTSGYLVTIYRDPAVTQTTSYNNNDPFPAKSHELALDKLTTIAQRLKDLYSRTVQVPDSDPIADYHLPTKGIRQNKLMGFDTNGLPVAVNGPSFVGGTDVGAAVVSTRAVAATTTFASSVLFITTGGLSAAGDGGGATYKRGTGSGSFTDGGGVSWVPFLNGTAALVATQAVAASTIFASTILSITTGGTSTVGDGGGATYKRGTGAGSFTDGAGVSWVPYANVTSVTVPEGRLTLASGQPVMATSVTAATTLYYAPFVGKTVPVNTGGIFRKYDFTSSSTDIIGLSIVLGANWAANTNYDVFVALNGGVVTLATGPDWSAGAVAGSNTVGSSTRGTGAGSTDLQAFQGLMTNKNSMTLRYANASTFTAAANEATYLGTFRTGSAGQISFTYGAVGTAATLNLWNSYNQVLVASTSSDITANWTYSSATIRQANANTANQFNFVSGLASNAITATAIQNVRPAAVLGALGKMGISLNSTTVLDRTAQVTSPAASTLDVSLSTSISYKPQLGANFISQNEQGDGTNLATFFGNALQQLSVNLMM